METGPYRYDPGSLAGLIVAASIHFGKYDGELRSFIERAGAVLESAPSAFLSVCLSAAQPEKYAEAEGYVRTLLDETGWSPEPARPIAGALRYREYGFIKRKMMTKIAEEGGLPTDTSRDHELTDWAEVEAVTDAFLTKLARRS